MTIFDDHTGDILDGLRKPEWSMPGYNPDGSANPKGDAAYWRARAEAAEAEVKRLREALERFAKIDLTATIAGSIVWDILNARAALRPAGEEVEK